MNVYIQVLKDREQYRNLQSKVSVSSKLLVMVKI